jgi:F0F1-type ATP synthase membrane subunit c/vacuolar-type H+-ATPase subunit K
MRSLINAIRSGLVTIGVAGTGVGVGTIFKRNLKKFIKKSSFVILFMVVNFLSLWVIVNFILWFSDPGAPQQSFDSIDLPIDSDLTSEERETLYLTSALLFCVLLIIMVRVSQR